jgi:hypothetical protein
MQLDVNTIHKWTENDYTELQEKFENTKGVIKSHKWRDKQHNA